MTRMSDQSTTVGRTPTASRPILRIALLALLAAVLVVPVQAALPIHLATAHPAAPTSAHVASVAAPAMPTALSAGLRTDVSSHLKAAYSSLLSGPPSSFRYTPPSLRASDPGVAPAAPHPAASSASNFYVNNSDCAGWGPQLFVPFVGGENIVQVGPSSSDLLAASGTQVGVFNVTGGTLCSVGANSANGAGEDFGVTYRSTDGGMTWTQSVIPRNVTHWQTPGDPTNGSITTGSSVVAAASNNVAAVITGYAPACTVLILPQVPCSGPAGIEAPWGFAVSSSSDGGVTWSNATELDNETALLNLNFAPACAAVGLTPGIYVANLPERPWIVTDGTHVVAGWDVFHTNWDINTCLRMSQAFVQIAYSNDGGATWNGPINISNSVSDSLSLAYGPASTHTVYTVFTNFANVTGPQNAFAFEKSTDGGATWSTEADIGLPFVNSEDSSASSPASFATAQFPVLAVDNWSSSPRSGALYLVWSDNQTGSYAGYPAIDFMKSTNGGTSWSSIQTLTAQTTGQRYLEPALSVGPDGTVWVTYYGVNSAGNYNVYVLFSSDGGATWSHQSSVTDQVSSPGNQVADIGFYMGSTATANGLIPIWSDCRAAACAVSWDVQLFTANVGAFNITSNAPGSVSVQSTLFASTTSYTLPTSFGLDSGAVVTVQTPPNVPYSPTFVDLFTTWAGASTSTNFRTTFTYGGSGNLTAYYTPVPASFYQGYVCPAVSGLALTLDGSPVTLTPYNGTCLQYTVGVASGTSYYLNASAPKYVNDNRFVPTNPGQTTWVNFTLVRQTGFLTGSVVPHNATMKLNDTVKVGAINAVTGVYNLAVAWGTYWLNISSPGFTPDARFVTVAPGLPTTNNFNLSGGWIYGTVKNAISTLVLKIDGVSVPTIVGTFNQSVSGGFHTLSATQPGYNLSVIQNIAVLPGFSTLVNVTLTDHGWISGTLGPTAALAGLLLTVTNGTQGGPRAFDKNTGVFNVSQKGLMNWTIRASASQYNTSTQSVYVTPGNATSIDIVLGKAIVPPCTVGVNCPPNETGGNNSTAAGFPLTTALIIVVLVIIVAAIAAVLLMRRRRQGGSDGEPDYSEGPAPDQTYAGSNPSDLPKLQSDGSMNQGNPPP
ncbi:MAG TPA: sialidase family protein [Thermoplasmata archaeon]